MTALSSKPMALVSAAIFVVLLASLWSRIVDNSPWRNLLKISRPAEYVCRDQHYTTQIISVDPLLIYINDFVSAEEAAAIVETGEPNLSSSQVYHPGGLRSTSRDRTSQSGALPPTSPAVFCLLSRARAFLGPNILAPHEDFGTPQMVRYHPGEHFDEHYDWYENPQPVHGKRGLSFNRVASFFVYLDDGGEEREGGETWFPRVDAVKGNKAGEEEGKWRRHEEGGTAFAPKMGNAVFWVNLLGNGTGDKRTMHAGLPLKKGVKTACNIWPRRLYGGG